MDKRKLHVQEITPDDFPEGVPALKWKRGLFYRPNNSGYSESLLTAGLYSREEVIRYCFDEDGKNGRCEVYGMPLWMAMKQGYWSKEKLREHKDRIDTLYKHADEEKIETVIF